MMKGINEKFSKFKLPIMVSLKMADREADPQYGGVKLKGYDIKESDKESK